MTFAKHVLLAFLCVVSTSAIAQERPAPAATVRPTFDPARSQFALGSTLVSLGVVAVGSSAALWAQIHFGKGVDSVYDKGFGSCQSDLTCGYHANDKSFLAGALVLDAVGIASAAVGGWLIARALRTPAAQQRVEVNALVMPIVSASPNRLSLGVGGTF